MATKDQHGSDWASGIDGEAPPTGGDTVPPQNPVIPPFARRFGLAATEPRRRSWVWFALPVFFDIIGGALAYYALRLDSPRMARDCLYIGIMLTVIKSVILAIVTLSALVPLGSDLGWDLASADLELRACLDGVSGLNGLGSIDADAAMECFREHAQDSRGAPPVSG